MVSPAGNPPCQSAWQFDSVFTGTVEEIDDPGLPIVPRGAAPPAPGQFPQRKVRFRIAEVFRGTDPSEREIVIETGLGGGDCGYNFQRGRDYIVYASKRPGGALSTGICSPTRLSEDAAADLKYLRGLAQARPTTEIRVTAYDVYGTWRFGAGRAPEPPGLTGVTITIDGPDVHQSSMTDAAGRHVFTELPPGEYRVNASLEGYTTSPGIPAVKAPSKGCAEVPLPLRLDRVVSGRVLTKDGQPASGVVVEAVPTRPRNQNDLPTPVDSATVDAEGRYELRNLRAGEYYLGISLGRTPTLERPYTRWFHPGTENPAAATIVNVADKPEVQRFDLTLPDPQHDRTIRGAVYWPDGRPAKGVNILLEDPRWPWQTFTVAAVTDDMGRFVTHALDGTSYNLHAAMPGRDPVSAVPAPIAPGGDPLDLQLIITQKGYSPMDAARRGLEEWRKGNGLR
jgi:hypothetical protein